MLMPLTKQQRIKNLKKSKRWEPWEIEYLEKHYQYKSNKEIAIFVGRTKESIASKLCGLKLTRINAPLTTAIRNMWEGSIQRARLFRDWKQKFSPPAKEPMSEFAEKIYQEVIERRENDGIEKQRTINHWWDWFLRKRDFEPAFGISFSQRSKDLLQRRAKTVGIETVC